MQEVGKQIALAIQKKAHLFFCPIGSLELTANATENRSNLIKGKEKVFQASILKFQGLLLLGSGRVFFLQELGGGEMRNNLNLLESRQPQNVCTLTETG